MKIFEAHKVKLHAVGVFFHLLLLLLDEPLTGSDDKAKIQLLSKLNSLIKNFKLAK